MTATLTLNKMVCGMCAAGMHDRCPVAIWSPGSGKTTTRPGNLPDVHEGEALYCPCDDGAHTAEDMPRCRRCGQRGEAELDRELNCRDAMDCELRISARLENDPLHQLVMECLTTRVVAGEVVERNRRATPAQVAERREKRAAAVARPCVCECGGTTKGGAFLPGHDARFVSGMVQMVADDPGWLDDARESLAPFPKLLAKFNKRVKS